MGGGGVEPNFGDPVTEALTNPPTGPVRGRRRSSCGQVAPPLRVSRLAGVDIVGGGAPPPQPPPPPPPMTITITIYPFE